MGGAPKTSTPYDRRLKENKDKPPHNESESGGKKKKKAKKAKKTSRGK